MRDGSRAESLHIPLGDGPEWTAGLQSQANFVATNVHDGHDDIIADHNAFVSMSRKDQHGILNVLVALTIGLGNRTRFIGRFAAEITSNPISTTLIDRDDSPPFRSDGRTGYAASRCDRCRVDGSAYCIG